ncbi:hypothetical protein F511_26673, partial [Dorcoceras hygrometricum]
IEDILISWAETEKVSELFQRRISFMVEQHMRRVVAEHWKNFHKDKSSAHRDIMAIRMLEAELAKTRKSISLFQAKSGLPIAFHERSTDRVASLEIIRLENKAQFVQLTNSTSDEQPDQGKEHQAPEQTVGAAVDPDPAPGAQWKI